MADWHYIGHYGQLGPLTDEQMQELIASEVIERATYVWCAEFTDWMPAQSVANFKSFFVTIPPAAPTPPPPPPRPFDLEDEARMRATTATIPSPPASFNSFPNHPSLASSTAQYSQGYGSFPVYSDRSRLIAGILNIVIPGSGRMYAGYVAHGIVQLFLAFFFFGWVWSVIDGLMILGGHLKVDGMGRPFKDRVD